MQPLLLVEFKTELKYPNKIGLKFRQAMTCVLNSVVSLQLFGNCSQFDTNQVQDTKVPLIWSFLAKENLSKEYQGTKVKEACHITLSCAIFLLEVC